MNALTWLMLLGLTQGVLSCSPGTVVSPGADSEDDLPTLVVTRTSLAPASESVSYSALLTAEGGEGTYAWSIVSGTLPYGLELSTGGSISGTPTQVGLRSFTVQVTSGDGQTATQPLSLQVEGGGNPRTIYFTETFEEPNPSARGWFANTDFTLTNAEQVSGSAAFEIHFPVGAQVPTFGTAGRILFPETESVYVSYWVKYSSNWIGSGESAHPHVFTLTTNEDDIWVAPASTRLTAYIEHIYQGGVVPRLQIQDATNIDLSQINVDLTGVTEDRAAAGCNGTPDNYPTNCYPVGNGQYYNAKVWDAVGPVLFDRPGSTDQNAWHFVEVYLELNTIQNGIGRADGVAQYWMDGELVIDVRDSLFRTGAHPTMAFMELLFAPYIGAGSPVDQRMWVDDLSVGDRR